ncbi:MAG: hypothetical protein M4579_006345, partial [Chaenotheca gracillima]
MDTVTIYEAIAAGLFGALIVYRLTSFLGLYVGNVLISTFQKHLSYALLFKRAKGASSISRVQTLCLISYLTANALCIGIIASSWTDVARNAAHISAANLVSLFLGGRTSLLANYVLRVDLNTYYFVHRWVGRVCLIEGLIHGILRLLQERSRPFTPLNTVLLITSIAIGLSSVLYIRRRVYELFLKSHLLLTLLFLGLLWFHQQVKLEFSTFLVCLGASTALLAFQYLVWFFMIALRNLGSGRSTSISFTQHSETGGSVEVVELRVNRRKSWTASPGQYVYVTLPGALGRHYGWLQAHPYVVAWTELDESEHHQQVSFLIQVREGFSRDLVQCRETQTAILDGPYGGFETVWSFDKVLFLANGIGLAAHLLSIRHLLERHEAQTAQVRRVTLVWFLDTVNQYQWGLAFLEKLLSLDHRNILNILIHLPQLSKTIKSRNRIYVVNSPLNFRWTVEKEWASEAGNMVVSVCGTPLFETGVRDAVRTSMHDISLLTSAYQPDETYASQLASDRFSTRGAPDIVSN